MGPSLALSLMSNNNATQFHAQPGNGQPVANTPPSETSHTTMDPDLARYLLQNNKPSVPKPSHLNQNQPTQRNPTPQRPANPYPNTVPLGVRPLPPDVAQRSSHTRQKLLKKLYPTPGVQPRDYQYIIFHPSGYEAFPYYKNPRGLPYPWCEFCRGDCWCVDRNTVFRLPEGGVCGCGIM
jgi:hypothetical protein